MCKDTKQKQSKSKKSSNRNKLPAHLEHINKLAAGIDIGSKSHFVAVPEGCDEICVREFSSFTTDLFILADWLDKCGIETVAMESTGVYWIPLYELLESRGFDVKLVDARHVKNVSGRKTDVLDCQWLQQLHTYGLLSGAFRPNDQVCDYTEKTQPEICSIQKRKSKAHCKNKLSFDAGSHLIRITGVDLTAIPGIEASTALKIISEIGLDLNRWKSPKQFASWLGLCPGNKVSGGKRLGGKSKRTSNNAASALKMAASTLHSNDSAIGAFFRRLKSRLGAPKATTATAHKIAIIMFEMIKNHVEYNEVGQDYYENQYRERLIKNLSFRAKNLGFELKEIAC